MENDICDRLVELAADRRALCAALKQPVYPLAEYTEVKAARLIRDSRQEVTYSGHGLQSIDIPAMLENTRAEDVTRTELRAGDKVRYKPAYGDNRTSFELVAFREGQCLLWGPLESSMSSGRGADPIHLERVK